MKINGRFDFLPPRNSVLASIVSGALIFLSFPKWNLSLLAWFAFLPLYFAVNGLGFWKSFICGWFAGLTAFCGILYWIIPTFQAAGVSIFVGLLALLLLASYLALFSGLFAAISENWFSPFSKIGYLLFAPALWTVFELLRGCLFTGFPWGLIGYSQHGRALCSIASVTGIYGISFFLLFMNGVCWILLRGKRYILLSVVLLLTVTAAHYKIPQSSDNGPDKFSVTLLQGNINQYKKWSSDYVKEILDVYESLAMQASREQTLPDNPPLVVWPETSLPGWYPHEQWLTDWLSGIVRRTARQNLVGSVTNDSGRSYNSAFLLAPDGKTMARYDKMHLVPFGEFVPMQNFLGKWIEVLNQLGGFDGGKSISVLNMPPFKLGVTICYESIFPELVRRQVLEGAEVLVNITNDGWYLDTAAQAQHFDMCAMRAIENGRYLARCANTGISGIVGPSGHVTGRTSLNTRTLLTQPVSAIRRQTFYTKHGNAFAGLCALVSAGAIIAGIRRKKDENSERN